MWLYAAGVKAADPSLFAQQIRSYGVFPSLAATAAPLFLWAEFLLGATLLLRVLPRWSLLGTAALLLMFIAMTAYAWSQGRTEDCGCFGRLGSRSPGEVIAEDSLFLALAGLAFWKSPWRSRARRRWIAAACALPLLLALPWIAPALPIDSLVTGVGPGYNIERLAADDLKVDLGEGSVLVALIGEDCRGCLDALPLLAALNQDPRGPKVVGVFAGDRARKRAWQLEHTPAFPLAHAPEKSLRQYFRRLPAFFLARDGRVREIWWGRAPRPEDVIERMAAS
jgi:uncharacterized membrane protein YphA (DoxX/SURF4 family)